ncbi:MAG: hypothetical protein Kow0037_04170 [Calditrichia bacterium]
MRYYKIIPFIFILLIAGCSHQSSVRAKLERQSLMRENLRNPREALNANRILEGLASYYGKDFHGKPTASGEIFDMYALTAAHKTLPLGTICRVTNLANHKSVIVKINDRGPFVPGRILDLSYGAAQKLNALADGVIRVKIEILEMPPSED